MNGEYKKILPHGQGELIVKRDSFKVQFYFPGPDLRFNRTFVTIDEKKIDSYIEAYSNNWQKYLNLKKIRE